MVSFDPRPIRDTLRARGVALNQPVTVDALDKLTRWAGGALHPDVVTLLREFDGFANWDFESASFISVWPVDKAIADDWTKRPMLAFSDWSLNAIIFGFDPLVGGPIISIEDARQVAPTYREFWTQLLSGRLL